MAKAQERRRRDAEASRRRLLEAGVKVFSARGPAGGSISMIARKAGINRRMLYYYFGSKEGLYRASFRYAYEQLSSAELKLADMALSAEELLTKLIRHYYEFYATHPHHVRLLMWENLRQGKAARELRIGSIKTPIIEALRGALDRGRREGHVRTDINERQLLISCMALSFFCFSNRYTISEALGCDLGDPGVLGSQLDHDAKMALDGIRTRC